jgi:tetratricopeptide (TPR) repeat protein
MGKWYYIGRAKAYKALGEIENAEKDQKLASVFDIAWNTAVFQEEARNEVETLSKTIKKEPDNPETYLERAKIYNQIGEFKKAIADIDKIFTIASANDIAAEDHREIFADTHMRRAWSWFGLRDYEKADADAKRACELTADRHCESYEYIRAHDKGAKALDAKDYQAAVKHYSSILNTSPEIAGAYANRAKAYRALGDVANAQSDEKRANELDEQFALMHELKFPPQKSELEKRIEGLAKLIEEAPDNAKGYTLRGLAFYSQGDYSSAIKDFSQSIKIESEYATAYNNRALSYAASKDMKNAAKDAEKACELDECQALGILKMLEDSNKAIKANPKNAKAYGNRASAYAWLDDLENATKDAKKACELGDCEVLEALEEKDLISE